MLFVFTAATFLYLPARLNAHVSEGSVLQVNGFYGTTGQPSIIEGDITGIDSKEWKNASVRSFSVYCSKVNQPGDKPCYLFITNDNTYLYIAIAAMVNDNGLTNYARIYFDQNHNHAMDVSTSTPYGEYYVEAYEGGLRNGGWNGSSWYVYSSSPAGLQAKAMSHGVVSGQPTWNFEFKIPLAGGTGPNGECFLNTGVDSEIGIQIFMDIESLNGMYWSQTNQNNTNPAGWGDLQNGIMAPDRTVSAPVALGNEPTVDGYILTDTKWNHYTSFIRNATFTNYMGSIITGSLYAKTGAGSLFLGLVVSTTASAGDSLSFFQDYNSSTGGNTDCVLTPDSENCSSMTYTGAGTGSYLDKYFKMTVDPSWASDGNQNGAGAVRHNGTSYEFECSVPLKGTGTYDLQVTSGIIVGFNPQLILKGSTYWWTLSTNSEWEKIQLDNSVYSSIGWAPLQTGAPVLRPVFPKDGDEVSGHYPFAIWATATGGTIDVSSAVFSDDLGASWKTLEQVGPEGFWTKTWNTTELPDGSREVRIKVTDANMREATLSLTVTVNNTQATLAAPTVVINNPAAGEKVTGTASVNFTATPVSPRTIFSVDMQVDGDSTWISVPSTYTYSWNTASLSDGAHIIRIRARDSATLVGYSDYRLVLIDNTVPSISNVTVKYPSGQLAAKAGDTIIISALILDDSAVNSASVVLNSSSLDGASHTMVDNASSGDLAAGDNVFTYSITVTTTSTGTKAFTVTASDNEGNAASPITGSVVLDNTAPVLNINPVTSPTKYSNQAVSGSYTEANLDSIIVNGIAAQVFVSSWSANVSLAEGTNTVRAVITDKAGNLSEKTAGILYDPFSPITVISPRAGDKLKGTLVIEAVAPEITVKTRFEISPDNGNNWYSLTGSTSPAYTEDTNKSDGWKQSWDTAGDGLSDGTSYQVLITAYEETGKTIASYRLDSIAVDNTPPVLVSMEGAVNVFTFIPLPRVVNSVKEFYEPIVQVKFKVTDATAGMGSVKIESLNENGDKVFYAEVNPAADGSVIQSIALVEGLNNISAEGIDILGNTASKATSSLCYKIPKESAVISVLGGSLESPDGTLVVIPGGALLLDKKISIKVIPPEDLIKPVNSNLKLTGIAREFSPEGLVFNNPAAITIPYTDASLDPDKDGTAEFDENKLEIYYWNGAEWIKVAAKSRDLAANTITAEVNHFSIYAILEDSMPQPLELKLYLTRNPFQAQTQTSFVFGLPAPATSVTISIYDLSGDLVHKLSKEGNLTGWDSLNWNGENKFGSYVGSGIYIYIFKADYADGSTGKYKNTVGVIK